MRPFFFTPRRHRRQKCQDKLTFIRSSGTLAWLHQNVVAPGATRKKATLILPEPRHETTAHRLCSGRIYTRTTLWIYLLHTVGFESAFSTFFGERPFVIRRRRFA